MVQKFVPESKPDKSVLCLVSQFGWLDIREAFITGSVVGDFNAAELSSNGIDDPASIVGKPDDVFSAMRMKSAFEKAGSSKSSQSPSAEPTE